MAEDEGATASAEEGTPRQGRFAVLDVFGLKLEVSNPRLAELLTMDAKDALGTDVRDLVGTQQGATDEEVAAPVFEIPAAAPAKVEPTAAAHGDSSAEEMFGALSAGVGIMGEAVLTPPTPHDEQDARLRREFRARVEELGGALGFQTTRDGLWHAQSGVRIVTRAIERNVSLAAATHYVGEIAARREAIAGPDSTALFIVDNQQTADVFKVAIRQRRLYDLMRTISIDNLEDIRDLLHQGVIDHQQAVVLLVPITNIDVGEVLSVVRSTRTSDAG